MMTIRTTSNAKKQISKNASGNAPVRLFLVGVVSLCMVLSTRSAAEDGTDMLAGSGDASSSTENKEAAVLRQIRLINQVPEDQLNEKADPGFSLIRGLYDSDGPDFLTLRQLLGQASIRGSLNPSARCVLAGVISQRWDTFSLSGNLYLSGLKSANADLREKSRHKLVSFIQPAHIPILIDMLKTRGTDLFAYEILQEVTGKRFEPSAKVWQTWWAKSKGKVDVVGILLKDTKIRLQQHPIQAIDQERFWYAPQGVEDVHTEYAQRKSKEQALIGEWNNWVNTEVRRYADDWQMAKPVLERVTHQPDPRVNAYLEMLLSDPGYGDYASVVLAWRASAGSLDKIVAGYRAQPTVARMLARGSLGDKSALVDLLKMIGDHKTDPLTFSLMQDEARTVLNTLRTVGVVPAEQAFELLCHHSFNFIGVSTASEKKKAFKNAKSWLEKNIKNMVLDRRRGYYAIPSGE